ncbi:MAG TPA: DUF2177 family protein, partial [Dehalococcoidia bacterium]
LATFIALFGLNALFHTFVAAALYDPHLGGITLPMSQANPFLVALVDVVLVAVMAYFILRAGAPPVQRREAFKAGALVGLVGAWTYNTVNAALIPSWPVLGTIVDVLWHVALGGLCAVLMAWVYNALADRDKWSTAQT